jgi:hypothetical protein
MKFIKRLFTKKCFIDGSVLWPSGKEHYAFLDRHGKRFEFDVLRASVGANSEYMIVSSSFLAINGASVPDGVRQEILSKSKLYFAERGQIVTVI